MQQFIATIFVTLLITGITAKHGYARPHLINTHIQETKTFQHVRSIFTKLGLIKRQNNASSVTKGQPKDLRNSSTAVAEERSTFHVAHDQTTAQENLALMVEGIHLLPKVRRDLVSQVKKAYGVPGASTNESHAMVDRIEMAPNKTGIFVRGHTHKIGPNNRIERQNDINWFFPIDAIEYTGDIANHKIQNVTLREPMQTRAFDVWGKRSSWALYPLEAEKLHTMVGNAHLRPEVQKKAIEAARRYFVRTGEAGEADVIVDSIHVSSNGTAIGVNGRFGMEEETGVAKTFTGFLPIETIDYNGELAEPEVKAVNLGEPAFVRTIY